MHSRCCLSDTTRGFSAVRLLGDVDDAEELTQDICVALVDKLSSYRGESRFTTWLYRVVVNAAHDAMRRNHARYKKHRDYVEVHAIERDGHVVTTEELVWLRWAPGQLSDEMRATVVLSRRACRMPRQGKCLVCPNQQCLGGCTKCASVCALWQPRTRRWFRE